MSEKHRCYCCNWMAGTAEALERHLLSIEHAKSKRAIEALCGEQAVETERQRVKVIDFTKPEECIGAEIVQGCVVKKCSYDAETTTVSMTVSLPEEKKNRPQIVMWFE